jgi:prepilin-type N-terminal cleavage/methylation domain-containing protein
MLVARTRAYTLIEMLIVVAIIVLLAAILLPAYETAIKHAERAVCLTNLKNITMAASLYAQDFDDRCVPARIDGPAGTYGTCWELLLQPYCRSTFMLLCASDPTPQPAAGSLSIKHSYGVNYDIALIGGYNGQSELMGRIEQPAGTILFFDLRGSARSMGSSQRWDGLSKVDARHGAGANFAFVAGNVKWYRPEATLQRRDPDSARCLWDP